MFWCEVSEPQVACVISAREVPEECYLAGKWQWTWACKETSVIICSLSYLTLFLFFFTPPLLSPSTRLKGLINLREILGTRVLERCPSEGVWTYQQHDKERERERKLSQMRYLQEPAHLTLTCVINWTKVDLFMRCGPIDQFVFPSCSFVNTICDQEKRKRLAKCRVSFCAHNTSTFSIR